MSVDKAKDTSPKKPIAENRLSKLSRNPPPRLKANRTLHRKSKVWARVRSGIKAYKDNWNDIFGKKKR